MNTFNKACIAELHISVETRCRPDLDDIDAANILAVIEQLQAKIAELEAEVERLKAECKEFAGYAKDGTIIAAQQQMKLAAAQAYAEQLRDLLANAIQFQDSYYRYADAIAEALSIPASTEALDKYVAEKVREAGKFDGWKTNPYTKVLETSIEQLTKQRDLAVEAMLEALECGEDGDWQSARRILASTIKEIEAK